jgi:hypothetical protein
MLNSFHSDLHCESPTCSFGGFLLCGARVIAGGQLVHQDNPALIIQTDVPHAQPQRAIWFASRRASTP